MGRQAYLTKIALGRSAFEPAQATAGTSEQAQLASAQQERSHEHGRRLREAQNDVLASVGVVERRPSPSQTLPGSYEERLRDLEEEDTLGHTLAIGTTLTENVCTWWVGSLRERLLTFHYQSDLSFSSIVVSERRKSGNAFIFGGFPSRFLPHFCIQSTIYGVHVLRPVERLLAKYGSITSRSYYRRWKSVIRACFRVSLEMLFYPFSYYSYLQRIGMVSAKPIMPPLKSFLPFSKYSPLLPLSIRSNTLTTPLEIFKALVTSPFVLMCAEHFLERWIYAVVNDPITTTIIRPTNPDMISPDHGDKERMSAVLGMRRTPPKFVEDAVTRVLGIFGWGETQTPGASQPGPTAVHIGDFQEDGYIEVHGNQIHNVNRLELPSVRQDTPTGTVDETTEMITVPISSLGDIQPDSPFGSPPLSPTVSQASYNDGDPRIRITTRGNLVEMEVRLPPHVLSSHTELAGSGPSTPVQHNIASPARMRLQGMSPYHRVTQLSLEPSSMLASICKAQIVSLVSLPLKLITLRLVASHYLLGRHGHEGSRGVSSVLAVPNELDFRSAGALVSRLALCNMLELAIDLSLWGLQYWTTSWIGTRGFNWGAL